MAYGRRPANPGAAEDPTGTLPCLGILAARPLGIAGRSSGGTRRRRAAAASGGGGNRAVAAVPADRADPAAGRARCPTSTSSSRSSRRSSAASWAAPAGRAPPRRWARPGAARHCRCLAVVGQRLLPRAAGRARRGAALRRLRPHRARPELALALADRAVDTPAVTRINRTEIGYRSSTAPAVRRPTRPASTSRRRA